MSDTPASKKEYPCPSCGATLAFNPQAAQLKCDYCGWEDAIPDSEAQVEERSYQQYLTTTHKPLGLLQENLLEVDCTSCGAQITFETGQISGKCGFCGSAIVAEPHSSGPMVIPEGIIPFKVGRREAQTEIRTWIKKLWFAPGELKQLAQLEKIKGVYLPFWTYDSFTKSHYQGERGEYYYTTETYKDDEGKTQTRQVRHTRWRSASGSVERFFDDVLIAATKLVKRRWLDALEPWPLKTELKPYESSYLAGFEAVRSQIDLEEGFEIAKEVMETTIRGDVRRDIGGDEQRIHQLRTNYSAITFKNIFLPIWIASYRYRNQPYQVVINAFTGEVQGERPYSKLKIALAVLAVLAIAGVIIYFSN